MSGIGERGTMTCAEFEQALADLLEGSRSLETEAHLKSCPKCLELVSDLRAITEESKFLRGSEEPPARLWSSIEATLRTEGLIREKPAQRPFLVTASGGGWRAASWLVPLAAALLVGVGFFMGRPAWQQVAQRLNPSSQISTPSNAPELANEEDQQVLAEISRSAPMMETAYQEDLQNVNSYIHDAEDFLRQHPNDNEAEQYLMEARQQKEMLYEMALNRSLP